MSLRYAILGLLSRESLTGYDLTKKFDTTIAFFWSAKHSQIYPELAALTKAGMVTFEVVTQTSKPNKKVYTITDEGCRELARWVAEPHEKRTVKDPMLLRTWVLGAVEPEIVLPQLKDSLVEWRKRIAHLDAIAVDVAPSLAENKWTGAHLALKLGAMQARTFEEWLIWAIAQVESQQAAQAATLK
jgi:DNA-binding PadR family transcriptional regulator